MAPPVAPPAKTSQIETVAVFGKDSRRILPKSRRDLSGKVGLLYDRSARSVCSAFCVAPNIVATAAHCLSATQRRRNHRLNNFTFQLGLKNNKNSTRIAGARHGLAALNVTTGTDHLRLRPPIDAARDWAFIRLERNICRHGHFKLSRRPIRKILKLAAKKKVYQPAFHRDFGNWKLALDVACPVSRSFPGTSWKTVKRDFQTADKLILHKCDTAGASSGSPLVVDGPDGPEAVAINVGTYLRAKMIMQNGRVMKKMDSKTIANTAVHAAPLRLKLQNFIKTPPLTRKSQVRELQQHLKSAGFYRGSIDGLYGPRMRFAIEALQRRMVLPVTGLASTRLLTLMRQQNAITSRSKSHQRSIKKTGAKPAPSRRKAQHQRTTSTTLPQ
ncbi:MAG: peptidoglycan-binding protein [Hyphomicrobiaceae bacterium]